MTRLEQRTPNTADCPDTSHRHWWRKRRPELTLGRDRAMVYDAGPDGQVLVSEEALAQLLRLAGFEPCDVEPDRQLCDPLPSGSEWSEVRALCDPPPPDAEPPSVRTFADPPEPE